MLLQGWEAQTQESSRLPGLYYLPLVETHFSQFCLPPYSDPTKCTPWSEPETWELALAPALQPTHFLPSE